MADEARWYVVHTYSGYENKVASNLEKTVENRQLQDLIQESACLPRRCWSWHRWKAQGSRT